MIGMFKSIIERKRNNPVICCHASTNDNGWSMRDVWNWGNEVKDLIEANQPKQRIKYGNNIVMLNKKEPINMVFASETM